MISKDVSRGCWSLFVLVLKACLLCRKLINNRTVLLINSKRKKKMSHNQLAQTANGRAAPLFPFYRRRDGLISPRLREWQTWIISFSARASDSACGGVFRRNRRTTLEIRKRKIPSKNFSKISLRDSGWRGHKIRKKRGNNRRGEGGVKVSATSFSPPLASQLCIPSNGGRAPRRRVSPPRRDLLLEQLLMLNCTAAACWAGNKKRTNSCLFIPALQGEK